MKLHTVNKLVQDMERDAPEIAREFPNRLGAVMERCHDEFEGRQCSAVVRNHAALRDVIRESCEQVVAEQNVVHRTDHGAKRRRVTTRVREEQVNYLVAQHPIRHYAAAFEAQDGIMHFMYGERLIEECSHCVRDYRRAIDAIGCPVTVLMHMLIDHAVKFCDNHGCGLLYYSEETSESLHSEIAKVFQQFKVPPIGHSKHAEYLIRVVFSVISRRMRSYSPQPFLFISG